MLVIKFPIFYTFSQWVILIYFIAPLEYDFRAFYLVRPRMQTKEIIAYRTEAFFQMGFIKVCI